MTIKQNSLVDECEGKKWSVSGHKETKSVQLSEHKLQ